LVCGRNRISALTRNRREVADKRGLQVDASHDLGILPQLHQGVASVGNSAAFSENENVPAASPETAGQCVGGAPAGRPQPRA
jgi:hypothetical protein